MAHFENMEDGSLADLYVPPMAFLEGRFNDTVADLEREIGYPWSRGIAQGGHITHSVNMDLPYRFRFHLATMPTLVRDIQEKTLANLRNQYVSLSDQPNLESFSTESDELGRETVTWWTLVSQDDHKVYVYERRSNSEPSEQGSGLLVDVGASYSDPDADAYDVFGIEGPISEAEIPKSPNRLRRLLKRRQGFLNRMLEATSTPNLRTKGLHRNRTFNR